MGARLARKQTSWIKIKGRPLRIREQQQFLNKRQMSERVKSIVKQVSEPQTLARMLSQAHKMYNIDLYNIKKFGPKQIMDLYEALQTKISKTVIVVSENSWAENQLKIFIWLLIAYAFSGGKHLSELTEDDWQFFSPIFSNRSTHFFTFQCKFILKPTKNDRYWSEQEINLLRKVITAKNIGNKWNLVARQLFIESNSKFFRTPKQCREKWLNHLDPSKKHSKWSEQQDYELFSYVSAIGKRWSQIAKCLNSTRTQHMVKNRYKAILAARQKKDKRVKEEDVIAEMLQNKSSPSSSLYQDEDIEPEKPSVRTLRNQVITEQKIDEEYSPNSKKACPLMLNQVADKKNRSYRKFKTSKLQTAQKQEIPSPEGIVEIEELNAIRTSKSLDQVYQEIGECRIQQSNPWPKDQQYQVTSTSQNEHFQAPRFIAGQVTIGESQEDLPFFSEVNSCEEQIRFSGHYDDESLISKGGDNPIFGEFGQPAK